MARVWAVYMARVRLCVAGIWVCVLAGCGGDVTVLGTPPPSTLGSGNWEISGFYEQSSYFAPYSFGGSLVNAGGQIAGVFHADTSCFGSGATDIPYTGSGSGNGKVSLTSAAVSGQVVSVTGTLAADGQSMTNASFTVAGGCTGEIVSVTAPNGPGAEIATTAVRVPELTGVWREVSNDTLAGPSLSEQLSQSGTPDAHGDYALSGTVAVQGSACFTSGTLEAPSFVSGTMGHERVVMNDGSVLDATLTVGLGAEAGAKPVLTLGPGSIAGGQCDGAVDVSLE